MSEPVSAILDKFHLSRAFSLPELLLRGLELEGEVKQQEDELASQKLTELLTLSPTLLLQSLIAFQAESLSLDLITLEQERAREKVFALIRRSTMQYNPLLLPKKHEDFHLLHWRHSLLCSKYISALTSVCKISYSSKLETTALLINFGEVILASVYGSDYFKLHVKTSSESELSRLEKQTFGVAHAELGAAFLERYGLQAIDCDAIRFHHRTFEEITDASIDVKLCWFANQLAIKEDIDFELVNAGQKLFSLEQEALRTIQKTTTESLRNQMSALKIEFSTNKRLPLPEKVNTSSRAERKVALLNQAHSINNINKILLAANNNKQAQFLDVLRILTADLFEGGEALIFLPDAEAQNISIASSTLPEEAEPSMSLQLSENPSIIAASYQNAEAKVCSVENNDLKVADLQILSALGKSALLCDPIVYKNKVVALIVFGVNKTEGESYLHKTALRNTLHHLYIEQESKILPNTVNSQEFHYQQKIREAVHEANNPLSIIKNYLKILSLKQEEDSELHEEIKVIETEIERVKQILSKLGNNSEPEDKASSLDLNKIITSINKVFSASIPEEKSISIEIDLDPKLPFVLGKENSLKQILINLLKNAAEACVENGLIRVETRSNINFNQVNYVLINIIDNGSGISENVMQNLFKPGNTSKGDSHTGSGLAIVKNFMDELGGIISCQSDPRGTTFALLLPRPEGTPQIKNNTDTELENPNNSPGKIYDFKR
ncbi:MAG: hypothetical protein COA71_01565 [SAR86 cluster bacterium]|uniref:histidine kinase n=1 Tax=SAR86 cluster bacterium TaxID=2030880 RepID=A0A2A5CJP0_9GAMM|nr:MAG: hypothetical protein COA71_01565 [SAR86 cluster bacterium]